MGLLAKAIATDFRANVISFFVLPECQGSGVGRSAMDAVESIAASPPISLNWITLHTWHPMHWDNADFWKRIFGPEAKRPNLLNAACA